MESTELRVKRADVPLPENLIEKKKTKVKTKLRSLNAHAQIHTQKFQGLPSQREE